VVDHVGQAGEAWGRGHVGCDAAPGLAVSRLIQHGETNGPHGWHLLMVCQDRRWLREDVSFDEIVEMAAVIAGVEIYLRIVHRDGWSTATYKAWCRRMLAETVFR
jgi:hypothetical protein